MTYIEFLRTLPTEEFAQIVAHDAIFNMACVENYDFEVCACKYSRVDCYKCILSLLNSEVDKDILKRNMQD